MRPDEEREKEEEKEGIALEGFCRILRCNRKLMLVRHIALLPIPSLISSINIALARACYDFAFGTKRGQNSISSFRFDILCNKV